jgi:hypothetical protein
MTAQARVGCGDVHAAGSVRNQQTLLFPDSYRLSANVLVFRVLALIHVGNGHNPLHFVTCPQFVTLFSN